MRSENSVNLARCLYDSCADFDKTLYFYKEEKVSFGQFYQIVANISRYLTSTYKKNDRILIALYDSPVLAELFVGALDAGMIPVVINPNVSAHTLSYMLEDSEAVSVVCEKNRILLFERVASEKKGERVDVIENDLTDFQDDQAALRAGRLSALVRGSHKMQFVDRCSTDAAFWQYTSGTTGNPKAVQHVAKTMIENAHNYAYKAMGINDSDRLFSAAKMFFGYGMGASLFFPLLLNTSCVLNDTMPMSDILVVKIFEKYKPTVFFGNPAIFSSLLQKVDFVKRYFYSDMRFVSAGAPLPSVIFEGWKRSFGTSIYDGIGATEMGHIFISNSKGFVKAGATGRPVDGYQVRLDNWSDSEGFGVLAVKGPHINMGYWNSPKKNEQKFVDGWYITGDLFQVDADGYYYYCGREDDLFKINGIWVSPLNIESEILSAVPEVKECALCAEENSLGISEPVLYVSLRDDADDLGAIETLLMDWMFDNCDPHERAKGVLFVDAMPRNDNGKVVRAKLRMLVDVNSSEIA